MGISRSVIKRMLLALHCKGKFALRPLMNCDSAVMPYFNNIKKKISVGMQLSSVCSQMQSDLYSEICLMCCILFLSAVMNFV